MNPIDLKDKRVLVVGLAKSGVAAACLCVRLGAKVTAADKRPEKELGEAVKTLKSLEVKLVLGPHDEAIFSDTDLMVVSPGVPLSLGPIQAAKKKGVQIIGEVELASRFLDGEKILGITGTNGKSTTTALCGCLCEKAGLRTFAGGNLGRPLSEAVLVGGAWDAIVCELSSFQLEGVETMRPKVACVTNLTPDHIDRYPSHEAYGQTKRRIFMNQTADDFAVANAHDAATMQMLIGVLAKPFTFGFGAPVPQGARFDGEAMKVNVGQGEERYLVKNRSLRGNHNLENAMVAVLAARLGGLPADSIQAGLDAFPGLAHRIEYAGTVNGVEYVNDSKGTNVDSTVVALKAFPKGIWLIAGGRGKGAPYAPMVEVSKGRVKCVLTIGEDAPKVMKAYKGVCDVVDCRDLKSAVEHAHQKAKAGEVVLLSPACASYDQFKNFEERGEIFKNLVKALPGFKLEGEG